jgi:osmotically inducible protein OsmC
MAIRKANARWEGDLKGGRGEMRFGEGAFEGEYSFSSRFEEGEGTNPEELIGAAHAGCFSMALASGLAKAGFEPRSIQTTANVHLEKLEGGFSITRVHLETEADVPGIDEDTFQDRAQAAKDSCPVSMALGGVEIHLTASLL